MVGEEDGAELVGYVGVCCAVSLPIFFLFLPVSMLISGQLLRRHDLPHDRPDRVPRTKGRPGDLLLHHAVVLVGADAGAVDAVAQRGRADQEERVCGLELYRVVDWECHWYVSPFSLF